jgi:hypothetical protein
MLKGLQMNRHGEARRLVNALDKGHRLPNHLLEHQRHSGFHPPRGAAVQPACQMPVVNAFIVTRMNRNLMVDIELRNQGPREIVGRRCPGAQLHPPIAMRTDCRYSAESAC